jgi:C-terminal processing protease CtpA/Prc
MDLLQPSPLSEVGVKVGDVIVSINGKAGRDLTPGVLGEALGGPVGSLLDLEIQADGKIRHVTLTLRDLL